MKTRIIKSICLLCSCTLLCACADERTFTNLTTPEERLHLSDYEQTPQHLGIDPTQQETSDYTPLNYTPQYGMWMSVNDYPEILMTQTKESFTDIIRERFDNMAALGINTVYVHVRAFGDAYYASELYAPGLYLPSGTDFDPLAIMVEEAHARDLSIHAWLNPLRCQSEVQMQEMDEQYILKQWYLDEEKNGTYLSLVDGRFWLCPAYAEVRALIADGAAEIVRNYEVDGIHIDDYFYPTTDFSFDAAAFAESRETNITQFRKEQCSAMAAEIYAAVKDENPDVLFGISPQGTLRGNNTQYSDAVKWCSEAGYCDYILPQIYFGLENESAPFAETASLWTEMVTCDEVSLMIGICTYKMGKEDAYAGTGKKEWQKDFAVSSKELALVQEMGLGAAIYSYDSTFCPPDEIADQMAAERERIAELLK